MTAAPVLVSGVRVRGVWTVVGSVGRRRWRVSSESLDRAARAVALAAGGEPLLEDALLLCLTGDAP